MSWEFELVAGPYGETTEGPTWDGESLLFTHIIESRIMRYDPQTGSCTEHRTGTHRTNGLASTLGGIFMVAALEGGQLFDLTQMVPTRRSSMGWTAIVSILPTTWRWTTRAWCG